jgi:hypothetical protein
MESLIQKQAAALAQAGGFFTATMICEKFDLPRRGAYTLITRLDRAEGWRIEKDRIDGMKAVKVTSTSDRTYKQQLYRLAVWGEKLNEGHTRWI